MSLATVTATVIVNTLEDGLLSSVDDVAVADVRDMAQMTVLINHVSDDPGQTNGTRSSLDLSGPGTNVDTVVEAVAPGVDGDNITITLVGDNDALTKASLDLEGPSTLLDTVIEATTGGAAGNAITIRTVADGSGAGSFTRVGSALTFHYEDGVTTVTNFETAVAALAGADDIIAVKTTGTGANILVAPGDTFTAQALAGGLDSEGVTYEEDGTDVTIHFAAGESTVEDLEDAIGEAEDAIIQVKTAGTGANVLDAVDDEFGPESLAGGLDGEGAFTIALSSSVDGLNFAPFATVDETDFDDGNALAFEIPFVDSNGMPKRAKQIKAVLTALDDATDSFSMVVAGTR